MARRIGMAAIIGNPALTPLVDLADDLLLVLANALVRADMPPRNARAIQERLNEITFNASVVLELNAIAGINTLLDELPSAGLDYKGRYRRCTSTWSATTPTWPRWASSRRAARRGSSCRRCMPRGSRLRRGSSTRMAGSWAQCSSCDLKAELIHPVLRPAEP